MELHAISLEFDGGSTAVLRLLTDREETRLVGLDGVYRVSPGALASSPVGIKGSWKGEREFEFFFNNFTAAQVIRAKAVFEGDDLFLRLEDPWDALDLSVRGTAKEVRTP